MSRVLPASLLTILFLGSEAVSQAQVKLQIKDPENSVLKYEETVHSEQKLTLAGMELPTKVDVRATTQFAFGKRGANGAVPVERKATAVSAALDLPGGLSFNFDSSAPDAKVDNPALEPLRDLFRKQTSMALKYESDKDGKVGEISGAEQGSGVDPKTMRVMLQQAIDRFPKEAVKPGETWERTETLDVGSGQILTFTRKYEYVGEVAENPTVAGGKKLDKITATETSVDFAIDPTGGLPITVKKSDLKVDSSKGEILFDRELGRVVQEKTDMRITGALDLTAGGMDLPGMLDLKIVSETKLLK